MHHAEKREHVYQQQQHPVIIKREPSILDFVQHKTDFPAEYIFYTLFACLPLITFTSTQVYTVNIVSVLFPLYWTIRSFFRYERCDEVQWGTYWFLNVIMLMGDYYFSNILVKVPYFYLTKFAYVNWLFLPGLNGAHWLYDRIFERIINLIPFAWMKRLMHNLKMRMRSILDVIEYTVIKVIPRKIHTLEDKIIHVAKDTAEVVSDKAHKAGEIISHQFESAKDSIGRATEKVLEKGEQAGRAMSQYAEGAKEEVHRARLEAERSQDKYYSQYQPREEQRYETRREEIPKERAPHFEQIQTEQPREVRDYSYSHKEEQPRTESRGYGTSSKDREYQEEQGRQKEKGKEFNVVTRTVEVSTYTTQPEEKIQPQTRRQEETQASSNKNYTYTHKKDESQDQPQYIIDSKQRIITPHQDKLLSDKDVIQGEEKSDYNVKSKERIMTPHADKFITHPEKIETFTETPSNLSQKINYTDYRTQPSIPKKESKYEQDKRTRDNLGRSGRLPETS